MPGRSIFNAAARMVWLLAFAGAMIDAVRSGTGAKFGLPDAIWATWIYVAVLGCCGLAVLLSAGSADRARAPRLLLGVGIVGYAPGQALYTQIVAHQSSATFPTLADYGWLAFYPCALGAVILIVRGSLGSVRRVALLDALVGALTMLAVGSVLVVDLALHGNGLHGGQVGNVVYSFADLVVAGIAIGTFALFGWRPPRVLALLALGFLLQTVEDTLYLHAVARGHFPTEGWVLVPWLASFVVVSAAAVFGRARDRREVDYESTATAVAPVTFALVLVAVTIVIMSGPTPWAGAIAVDGCALVAVVSRMGLTLRSNVALLGLARDDSITDVLTGLGNRRALLETAHNAVGLAMTGGPKLTVALYDLDGFKRYNDSYGHAAGMLSCAGSLAVCARPCRRRRRPFGSAAMSSASSYPATAETRARSCWRLPMRSPRRGRRSPSRTLTAPRPCPAMASASVTRSPAPMSGCTR
jgi:hypothetical protein